MKNFKLYLFLIACVFALSGIHAQDFAAVSFGNDGDYISTNWNPAFGADQDFSIDFNIRTDGWSSDPAILSDKDWGSGTNAGFNIALASSGNGIDVNVGDGTNRADLDAGQISDSRWHHVLVSFDRDGELTMYIDGVEVQSTDMSNVGDITSPFNFNMGQDGTGTYSSPATCDMTNVRIWNAALSFDNIADIACNIITPAHPFFGNLTHYWALQEATGTVANEAIGMENGTLQGATSWTDGLLPDLNVDFSFATDLSTVEFTNTSTDATAFFWAFGDGNTSNSENPSHTYLATGTYEVTLTASNACESQTIMQSVQINELNTNLKQAINLDGNDDFVQLNNDLNFGTTQDFTIELLVRSQGWSSDPSIIANKDWGSGSNPGFIIAGKGNGESWKFNIGDGSERIDLDGGIINDGLWHHIAVTYDQDGMKKIYQDGSVMEESSEILGNIDSPLNLAIGQDGTFNYGSFFAGQVAEVRIWTAALDSATLADNVCEATANHPNAANLMHYWKLDEGSGTIINDSQGSNNGTYNGEWNTTLFNINCEGAVAGGDFSAITLGDAFLTTEWVPDFEPAQDFSIDFRIRTDGWSSDPSILSNKDWGSGSNVGFNIALASNGQGIDVNAGDGSDRADLASGAIADGEWHHVLVTFDRDGELSMYIDGSLTESTSMAAVDTMTTDFTFNIGQDGTGNYPATTPVDLAFVRVWNSVVSFDDVNACGDFDNESPLWDQVLHFWKMNEGTGNPADSKGGQTATWQGAEAWTFLNNYPAAQAAFSSDVTLSNVVFTNNSTNGSYFWDFGDGNTSTASNPAHLYFNTGDFDVKLVTTGACSTDSTVQTITINELDGNLLTSLDLDGNDDYVQFTNDLDFGSTGDFTVELLVKSGGWNSDPSIIANKDWGSGSNPGFIIAGKGDGTTWKLNIGDGSERIDLDGGVINDNTWHHIAVSYDQDGTKAIYQDGMLMAESTEVLGDINSALDLAIGQDGTLNYGANFNGQVAEVRIWSAALDATTISTYVCGADDTHPAFDALLHYWKCDEGIGTITYDAIGSNNGTYNGDWIVTANTIEACQVFAPTNDIGPGNAIGFAPDDTGWIDCNGAEGAKVSAASLGLPTTALTVECWVKPKSYSIWHSMVSFIQDNGSFEKGWDLETNDGNRFSFALSTDGTDEGLIYLSTTSSFDENKWYHVAGVFDGTEQRIYVNGVLENARPTDGSAIDYADSWLALGIYKDDNENFTLDGDLDEVRIWNKARTVEEIRADMCQKLTGNEADLFAYYRLDNLSGLEIRDYGPNSLTGEMINMNVGQTRVLSGAAIGDESVEIYTNDWANATLEMTTADRGNVIMSDFAGNQLAGLHLYRVNQRPNTIDGIYDLGDNDIYYGTYIADSGNGASHKLTYNYANYTNAANNEASLSIYNRSDNVIPTWLGAGSSRDEANDEVFIETIASRREFILGDFSASPCSFPSDITLDNASFSEATLSWMSNGSNFNIQYELSGFPFGSGISIENSPGANITLTDLEARNTYDMYLQADCGNGVLSSWVGPFTFMTEDPCAAPFNIETTSVTSSSATINFESPSTVSEHDLQWGTPGFTIGTGISTTTTADSFNLQFLPPNTALQYYVRSNCMESFGIFSGWVGPFDFMTLMPTNTTDTKSIQRFDIFPNPTSGKLNIAIVSEADLSNTPLTVVNSLGQIVHEEVLNQGNVITQSMDLSKLAPGTYYLRLVTEQQSVVQPFVVQQ